MLRLAYLTNESLDRDSCNLAVLSTRFKSSLESSRALDIELHPLDVQVYLPWISKFTPLDIEVHPPGCPSSPPLDVQVQPPDIQVHPLGYPSSPLNSKVRPPDV